MKSGDRISIRLVHCFEMEDGKIAREIAYEMLRPYGAACDFDSIPPGAVVAEFAGGPHYGQW